MVFTLADARLIPWAQYVRAETASTWLDEVRAMIEHHDWPSYNMTDTHADWGAFLPIIRAALRWAWSCALRGAPLGHHPSE
jgi:hypothetical protein